MRLTVAVSTYAVVMVTSAIASGGAAYAQPSEKEAEQSAEAKAKSEQHGFLEPKPDKSLTFYTPGGEITAYGYLDVSFDAATKGISDFKDSSGNGPAGNVGWLADMSTNLSYIGARGFQRLGGSVNFIYQVETQVDIAATSGTPNTNSNAGTVVRGGLTSRNTYIGVSSQWGALKGGKTDAPYKLSTARMNPFSGMIGDYQVVMGNTGGDNRVEFGTRLDHSIWYESPKVGGFSLSLLFSPGQNRSDISDNIPAGESDCTGGNVPGSGGTAGAPPGTFPISCNDGSFSDAMSAGASYEAGPLYVTAAYERHRKVNRNSDIYGIYGVFPLTAPIARYDLDDVADEGAAKVGVQFTAPTGTTINGIFEDLRRFVPQHLAFQNERQRTGLWLAVSQQLTLADSVHVGWAHAFKAQGDPGQHNTASFDAGNGGAAGGPDVDNSTNMITGAVKHQLAEDVIVYATFAASINHRFAHYDLGAGGRAVTTDCHDGGLPASGDVFSNPHCWAGGHLKGFSIGLNKRF